MNECILIDSAQAHSIDIIAKLLRRISDIMLRGYILLNFQAEKLHSQVADVKTMAKFNNLYISWKASLYDCRKQARSSVVVIFRVHSFLRTAEFRPKPRNLGFYEPSRGIFRGIRLFCGIWRFDLKVALLQVCLRWYLVRWWYLIDDSLMNNEGFISS